MMLVFMVLAVILSVALIVLVTIQPRQTQIFSTDATSNIGKPSYWASQPIRKMLTLAISIALFILLLIFMIVSYKQRTSYHIIERSMSCAYILRIYLGSPHVVWP